MEGGRRLSDKKHTERYPFTKVQGNSCAVRGGGVGIYDWTRGTEKEQTCWRIRTFAVRCCPVLLEALLRGAFTSEMEIATEAVRVLGVVVDAYNL